MSDIYLLSDYGKLTKSNKIFHFLYPNGTVSKYFPHNTERIFIIGNIEITAEDFKMIMRHKIELVFLNKNGFFNGKLVFDDSKNVLLRKKQYQKVDDPDFIIKWCKSIIDGKIRNQLSLANRIKRKNKQIKELHDAVDTIKAILQNMQSSHDVNQLRGYEGAASKAYFSCLRYAIMPSWAQFNRRSMNPPGDKVNAILRFTYTLTNHLIESYCLAEGLDTYVGFLHTTEYGRKSLVFDLLEEFRSPLCDTLTISLFNLGILSQEDFTTADFCSIDDDYPLESQPDDDDTVTTRKGVLLTKDGLKKVISKYEEKLQEQYYYMPLQKSQSYRKIIAGQAKHCKRVLNNEELEYKPFVIK